MFMRCDGELDGQRQEGSDRFKMGIEENTIKQNENGVRNVRICKEEEYLFDI